MSMEQTRRERARAATLEEIVETARRLLIASGPGAVTLRAIAREMGMTAPGLYRYVTSHEDLMGVLISALYDDATAAMEKARDAAGPELPERLMATSRAFRRWALANPAELGLVFGSPLPGFAAPEEGPTEEAGRRFGSVFLSLFAELWASQPFPVRPDSELDPRLVADLRQWSLDTTGLPLGALEVFLRCWMRLYGAVTMEGFGQLRFAVSDSEPLFELELAALGEMLGMGADYRSATS
jgi:AcrR family transcriptional regulator